MTPDLTLPGAALVSTCIIAGGILIAAQIFAVEVPFAPYVMVALAALVVLGAAMLVLSCRGRDVIPS
ncbi:hypothetical protein FGW20_04485 [Methanoculleus sp. FWC-SCC3]|uniref:Uncharacterized protein n=1 Tax=Methanoculleus methanifontis TaxID=2584086 RepID=A0ABT8M0V2_9EURY|nr:hypothetical protein [Methanoculleus sp. FWC-SCC3]MDN7012308.1 hypothetical protein [Methanoculleus sp. FWC-SCC3]